MLQKISFQASENAENMQQLLETGEEKGRMHSLNKQIHSYDRTKA